MIYFLLRLLCWQKAKKKNIPKQAANRVRLLIQVQEMSAGNWKFRKMFLTKISCFVQEVLQVATEYVHRSILMLVVSNPTWVHSKFTWAAQKYRFYNRNIGFLRVVCQSRHSRINIHRISSEKGLASVKNKLGDIIYVRVYATKKIDAKQK